MNSSHTSQKIDERFPHGTKLTYDCGVNRNSDPLGGIYCQENDRWNNKVTCVDYETNISEF